MEGLVPPRAKKTYVENEIQGLVARFKSLTRSGVNPKSKEWVKWSKEYERAKKKLESLKQKVNSLEEDIEEIDGVLTIRLSESDESSLSPTTTPKKSKTAKHSKRKRKTKKKRR